MGHYELMHPTTIITPTAADEWRTVAKEFNDIWNFPHCLGAVDGKHVVIQAPSNSGSSNYNYKGS